MVSRNTPVSSAGRALCKRQGGNWQALNSEEHDGDAAIAVAEVGVALEVSVRLQKFPGGFVGLRPVLAKDAGSDLAVLKHFHQALLHGDANVAAGAGRSVAVD